MTPITTECNGVAPFDPVTLYIGFKRNKHRDLIKPIHSSMVRLRRTQFKSINMTTTLEAAAEFGYFTQKQATAFLKEHDLTWEEATADLGDSALDAHELCLWIGY